MLLLLHQWWGDSVKWIPGITGIKIHKQTTPYIEKSSAGGASQAFFCMTLLFCSAQVSYTHLQLFETLKVLSLAWTMDGMRGLYSATSLLFCSD